MKRLLAAVLLLASVSAAVAQISTVAQVAAVAQDEATDYPVRPIMMVMPFAAGGPADAIGRLVATKLSIVLGRQVVVENRTGAGGTLAAALVARAAPDGYTLLYATSSTLAIGPALYRNLPYDPEKGFAPVSEVAAQSMLLLVNPTFPAKSVRELVAYAKANPGKLNYGSAGNGTPSHMGAVMFDKMAGIDVVHVPFRSGGEALTAVLQGQVQFTLDAAFTAAPHVEAGQVRALAVTGAQRSRAMPDVPTIEEAGLAGYAMQTWNGVVAPAGTPPAIVARLNDAIRKVLASPDVLDLFAKYDSKAIGNSPTQFATEIASEIAYWKATVAELGIKTD